MLGSKMRRDEDDGVEDLGLSVRALLGNKTKEENGEDKRYNEEQMKL